jgi:hypothetical protein
MVVFQEVADEQKFTAWIKQQVKYDNISMKGLTLVILTLLAHKSASSKT